MDLLKILLVFLVIAIIFKPLILMVITSLFGYEKRTAFLTSLSLGQVSEFSLILVGLGFYTLKHISQEFFSLVVFLTIITIILTSYFIKHDDKIYSIFSKPLNIFSRLSVEKKKLEYSIKGVTKKVILFGCHRMGIIFLNTCKKMGKSILVVDYNPETIKRLIKEKVSCIYGDMTNDEILKRIPFEHADVIISSIPDIEKNLFLVNYAKGRNSDLLVFITANHIHEALDLYEAGADYVILPHISTAEVTAHLLQKTLRNKKKIIDIRNQHIKHLLKVI
jgi:voltage-gated potassium channel Kch